MKQKTAAAETITDTAGDVVFVAEADVVWMQSSDVMQNRFARFLIMARRTAVVQLLSVLLPLSGGSFAWCVRPSVGPSVSRWPVSASGSAVHESGRCPQRCS